MPPRWNAAEVTLAGPAEARDLAQARRLGIAVTSLRDPNAWQLVRSKGSLELRGPPPEAIRLALDLRAGPMARRLRNSRRDEPLPRAIGLARRTAPPSVVDATAGLGRDAMVLCHLGCEVTALERIPALVMLVLDAIEHSALAARLRVVATDAVPWLHGLTQEQRPAVVYLDPMFSESGSAQVKKDMQVCRALAGPPDDPLPLFHAARRAARERVVVKRHRDLEPIAEDVSFAVAGSRIRFDVYLVPPDRGGTVSETRAP
ncbi:MAG TPA: class I SAM-dependent methyltransferase [Planctomycetota bacterium]|nr:class I SAM-dependent methyltransferase [Planctomycetota bacterium]